MHIRSFFNTSFFWVKLSGKKTAIFLAVYFLDKTFFIEMYTISYEENPTFFAFRYLFLTKFPAKKSGMTYKNPAYCL